MQLATVGSRLGFQNHTLDYYAIWLPKNLILESCNRDNYQIWDNLNSHMTVLSSSSNKETEDQNVSVTFTGSHG